MSGGSMEYLCYKIMNQLSYVYDPEIKDLMTDLAELMHDLEWWQSGDYDRDSYEETLSKFKAKWFKGDRQERLKGYIDEQIGIVRSQLYSLIGEPQESEDKE